MTYHVAFDISERYVEAAIGVIALLCAVVVLSLALIPASRKFLRRTSGLWLAGAAVLVSAFGIHNDRIPYGLFFPLIAIPAFVVAPLALWDRDVPMRDGSRVQARSAAPILAVIYLVGTALPGC